MAQRPVLSNYPHLHSILRNDPTANRDFNAILTAVSAPQTSASEDTLAELELSRRNLQDTLTKLQKQEKTQAKILRFISLLGGVIEPQVRLSPYSQDLLTKTHYDVRFSPDQIRMALNLYWDAVGEGMENVIARTVKVDDPAADRDPVTDE
jgi:hypothetical protein